MDKKKLNSLRRMAGVPQDFSADRRPQHVKENISQIFRGGDQKFYLVADAKKGDELGDVLSEVDFPALVNILKSADSTKEWELFPHNQKNKALDLARKRMAMIDETVGMGAWSRNADNTPPPTDEELAKLEQEEGLDYQDYEDDWEPSTNICPECEGGEHPPAHGVCERCGGEGEIYEAVAPKKCCECDGEYAPKYDTKTVDPNKSVLSWREECGVCSSCWSNRDVRKKHKDPSLKEGAKTKPDFADVDKDETMKKAAKEEQEEVKKCACGCDPKKCTCKPDCKCGCNAVVKESKSAPKNAHKSPMGQLHGKASTNKHWKRYQSLKNKKNRSSSEEKEYATYVQQFKKDIKESMHYYDTKYDSFTDDEDSPINVDSSYENVFDKEEQNEEDYEMANDTTPIKVPAKILSELKRVIKETTAESEKAKPRDFERAHYYEATAEALQIVHDLIAEKTVEGLKRAQIYVHKMANVSRALIPDVVWKFIIDGGTKRSLKSYVNDVKEPVTGKPFGIVDVKTLNKNTNTE